MKKNKKIIIIVIIVLLINVALGLYLLIQNKKHSSDIKINDVTLTNEQIELDDYMNKLMEKLNEYGNTLVENNEYMKFEKQNDIYFISLMDLNEKYNYDISIFVGNDGTICDSEKSGIYFDKNQKIFKRDKNDKGITVPILIGCEDYANVEEELPVEDNSNLDELNDIE